MTPASGHHVHSKTAKIAETLIVACRTAYDGLRTARQLDCIGMPGTGLLDDFNCSPRGIPLTLWLSCAAARLMGTPLHFVSIGAGPIVGGATGLRTANMRSKDVVLDSNLLRPLASFFASGPVVSVASAHIAATTIIGWLAAARATGPSGVPLGHAG